MIDASVFTNEQLQAYDKNMIEIAAGDIDNLLQLSIDTWAEILRELDLRGLVELLRGSYNDLATADIRRLY